ncbi:hypothetical protein K440DRAFT_158571 [Wilcoxina mikolae CBS 423.85]|nr:hypothetical protein K440DRAFT_158571 [Wilcoxina mikolae CBS 423.85]
MASNQTIRGRHLAVPDFRDGGSRAVRRAVSNLEAVYTPTSRALRQTESDFGQLVAGPPPMPRTLRQTESDLGRSAAVTRYEYSQMLNEAERIMVPMTNPNITPLLLLKSSGNRVQETSSLFDDLNGPERATIQGLGLQTDFENLRRPVFNSLSAPGNALRTAFVAQEPRMPLTRRATDMGLMARLVDKYDGTDDEGGVSLRGGEEEQPRDG